MRRILILLIALIGMILISPAVPSSAEGPSDPVFVGAGDIASCSLPGDEQTAKLVQKVLAEGNATVFTAGDNAYEFGSPIEYERCYGPSWGQFKKKTRPAPGNHEYVTPWALGYFDYFGALAGPTRQGYYSFNLGTWHIISLDSNQDMRTVGFEGKWLRADLKANPAMCTLAYWHHPFFSSVRNDTTPRARQMWALLYGYGVDVIVNGHLHLYERFAPQNPSGRADPEHGIREFIVGTGGATLNKSQRIRRARNSEVLQFGTWGVLKLTLHPTSYDWEFIPVEGSTFHDSGSGPCVTSPAVTF